MSDAQGPAATAAALKTRDSAKLRRRKLLRFGLAAVFLILLIDLAGAFDLLEYKSIDGRFQYRGPRPMQVKAAIVAIDDESLNGWVDAKGVPTYMPDHWTWPRDFYAQVIRNLKQAGAKLIVFDILFSESSKRDPKQDLEFAAAAKDAGNVIFGERDASVDVKEAGAFKTETLISVLDKAKLDIGFVNVFPSSDGSLRSMQPLLQNTSGDLDENRPIAELAVLRHLLGIRDRAVYDPATNSVRLGARIVPLGEENGVDINFAGPVKTVPTIPFHDVYNRTTDMSQFKDRVVYIGSTAAILHDVWRTPFSEAHSGVQDYPGVEARIHFLDTLLTQQYLHHMPGWFEALMILCLGTLCILLTYRITASQGIVVAVLLALAWVLLAVIAFNTRNWVLPMVGPLFSVLLPFALLAMYRGVFVEKDARQTRQLFSRYVSRQIVDEILKNPEAVGMGGALKETTILFSDVRGFTAMSEKLSAPQVVEVLNEYLTAMVDIVIANDGTVDKYVGDAIMAVWGSPLPDPQHRQKAMRTAVQMMEVLKTLQVKWKAEGKPHIDIGIGLNTGQVVAGNMGHLHYKMDYTVIGDEVNLAARMESANKEMRSHILVTGSSYAGCEDMVDVIMHPPIHVKGKEAAIDVIEVIGWKGQGRAPWAEPLPLH
jgi:adenylate cyclase